MKLNVSLAIPLFLIIIFILGYISAYSNDIQNGIVVVIGLIFFSFFLFRNNPDRKFLLFALFIKILFALTYIWVGSVFYKSRGAGTDYSGYHEIGIQISESFKHLQSPNLKFGMGTRFLCYVTGFIYVIVGPTLYGGFFVFSWLSFIGMYLFYKAFIMFCPEGNSRLYSYLIFLFPSILFWTSQIGKDSLIFLFLGLAAYSITSLFVKIHIREILYLLVALSGIMMIRPHIAASFSLAFTLSLIISGRGNIFSKIVLFVVSLIIAYIIFTNTISFLGLDTSYNSFNDYYLQRQNSTYTGGSRFHGTIGISLKQLPLAILNTIFRPFIWEAHHYLALIYSIESIALAFLMVKYFLNGINALLSFRKTEYISFILFYSSFLILMLSTMSNFGMIARQKVQLLPFIFVFISYYKKQSIEYTAYETNKNSTYITF